MQWLAVALAFAGLVLLLEPAAHTRDGFAAGLAVGAGLSWAASNVVVKRLRRRGELDLLMLAAWQMLLGSLVLIVVAALVPSAPMVWTPYFIGALIYNIVPATAVAWLLWLYVLNRLPAGLASLTTLAIPVIGVLCAWLELGERPGATELAGMALIAGGLALLSLPGILSAGTKPEI